MPIREALRILHGEGLVVIEPNRGARVRPIYAGFIEDIFDVRSAIETMLARRAALRRTDAHLERMRAAAKKLERMVAKGDRASVPIANREFHRAINDAAGNPGALPIVDSHWLLLSALLKRYGHGEERFARVIDEHRHLILAIERRDAHAAAMLMAAHIEKGKTNLLQRAADVEPDSPQQERWDGAIGRGGESGSKARGPRNAGSGSLRDRTGSGVEAESLRNAESGSLRDRKRSRGEPDSVNHRKRSRGEPDSAHRS